LALAGPDVDAVLVHRGARAVDARVGADAFRRSDAEGALNVALDQADELRERRDAAVPGARALRVGRAGLETLPVRSEGHEDVAVGLVHQAEHGDTLSERLHGDILEREEARAARAAVGVIG